MPAPLTFTPPDDELINDEPVAEQKQEPWVPPVEESVSEPDPLKKKPTQNLVEKRFTPPAGDTEIPSSFSSAVGMPPKPQEQPLPKPSKESTPKYQKDYDKDIESFLSSIDDKFKKEVNSQYDSWRKARLSELNSQVTPENEKSINDKFKKEQEEKWNEISTKLQPEFQKQIDVFTTQRARFYNLLTTSENKKILPVSRKQQEEAMSKWAAVSAALKYTPTAQVGRGVYDLLRTAYSGITDQIPKEYYVQRLRMSKGDLGDLMDSRSNFNQFGDKLPEVRSEIRKQFGDEMAKTISRDSFSKWRGQNETRAMLPYKEQAELFFREKLGKDFDSFIGKFGEDVTTRRLGFEEQIQEQNKDAASKMGGMVQNLKEIKSASDFASFTGNMIGQAAYRAPMAKIGFVTSIISESAAVYDRQIDIIAEENEISREEVIKKNLDAPASGQAVAMLLGTMDAISTFNMVGMFRKSVTREVKKSTARAVAEGIVKAAAPEAATETIQTEGEEAAAAMGADAEYKFDPWRVATAAVGGVIGGGALGGVSEVNAIINEQVKLESENVKDSMDVDKVNETAEKIQETVEANVKTETSAPESQATTESNPTESGAELPKPESSGGQPDIPPTTGTTQPPNENESTVRGQKPRGKALENRAFTGATRETTKAKIKEHGLMYQPESFEAGRMKADTFIEEVGFDEALTAARLGEVEGSARAYIFSRAIDDFENRIAQTNDPAEIEELTGQQADLVSEFGTAVREGGRFISALQDIYANSDFNYSAEGQIEKYKAINKGMITPENEQKFRDLEAKLKDANAKIREFEVQRVHQEEINALNAIKKEAEKAKAKRSKLISSDKKKEIANFFDSLKVKDVGGTANDITRVVGSAIWNGSMDAVKSAVLAGADVANAVQAGVRYIQDNFKGEGFNPDEFVQRVQPGVEQLFPKKKEKSTKSGPSPAAPDVKDGRVVIPNSILLSLVEAGNNTIESLTTAVHGMMSATNPEITERQVRDAITQYGKVRNLSKDDIKVKLREIKRIGRLISGMEDVVEKQTRPLRSGLQRDKPTDEERRMQRDLRDAMKELPIDEEESVNQLKTALDQVKSRLKNQISDLEDQITNGKKTPKKKGIEYDDEAKDLQSQRDDLRKVLEEIEGKPEMSEEQKIRNAIAAAERSATEYQRKIDNKDFSQKKSTTPETPELKQARANRDAIKKVYDDLLKESGAHEKRKLETAKKAVERQIAEYQRRIKEGDFVKTKPNPITPDDALSNLRAQKIAIKDEFDKLQYQNELANRTKFQKAIDYAIEFWGLTRALRATGEFSFILLQGGVQTIAHPKNALTALKTAFKHFASEKKSTEWLQKVRAHEAYPRMKETKLAITEPNAKLEAREEQFLGGWVNMLWDIVVSPTKLIGREFNERVRLINPFKAVERAGIGYLNTIRVLRYLDGEEMLRLQGKTYQDNQQDYKNVSDVINTFTGRASLGPLEQLSKPLAIIFFSPRNWASVIKQTTPYAFYHFGKMGSKGDKWYKPSVAQKMALGDYMKYVGLTGAMVMLVAAAQDDDDKDGWKVELDPTSSDFLKLRSGNTRVDPWGGRVQMIVLQARLILGSMKVGSEKRQLGEGRTPTEMDLIGKMAANKFAPSTAIVFNLFTAQKKKVHGEVKRVKYGKSVELEDTIPENVYPIYWETMKELHQDQPLTIALFLDFMAFLGMGTQTYEAKKKKKE